MAQTESLKLLETIYDDAAKAATWCNIVQFGFTCISWEPKSQTYVTKSFNLPLNPGVPKENGSSQLAKILDRRFGGSMVIMKSLQQHRLKLSTMLDKGVPYISVWEVTSPGISDFMELKAQAKDHLDVWNLPPESIDFYRTVGDKIDDMYRTSPLKIYNPRGGCLNRLQKQLIHQAVEVNLEHQSENHHYQAFSVRGNKYMEIRTIDATDERARRMQAIFKQTGARLLWDAISGMPFADYITSNSHLIVGDDPVKAAQLGANLKEYECRLQNQRPILVGHNLLLVVCCLFRKFHGPLPQKVDEFYNLSSWRLPRIVDTRLMFFEGRDGMGPGETLRQHFDAMKDHELPLMRSDPSYGYAEDCPQQAGYDSYMTAIVFIKKSYEISLERVALRLISASTDLGKDDNIPSEYLIEDTIPSSYLGEEDAPSLTYSTETDSWHTSLTRQGLTIDQLREHNTKLVPGGPTLPGWLGTQTPNASPADPTRPPTQSQTSEDAPTARVKGPAMVPEWGGEFWEVYGNKMRVGPLGLIF